MTLVLLLAFIPATRGRSHVDATSTPYNWLQFDGDAQHDGNNTLETTLNATNVGRLHVLFQVPLNATAPADGEPVYLSSVNTISGTRDVLCT
jgi:hypothetical protein